jgi:alanyl-tRNA synthetase
MGDTGPCGPCSEIFYDQGEENFNSDEDYLGGEGDRFLEIWNLVFMQYERDASGKTTPLPKPSIDTGMGLERVVAIKEGKFNNFDSSLFMPIINKIQNLATKELSKDNIGSFRVIADHLRAVCFMISQGILFDKEGRGYVLRRILRRAVRHGYLLGFRKPFMAKLVDTLDSIVGSHYIDIREKKEYIKEQITLEEDRFFKTIESGMSLFEEELKNTKDNFSAEVAFKLYDTFGFPLDLTQDMLRDKNLSVDIQKFEELMTISLLDENFKEVKSLDVGQTGWVMLDKTPFYAQSGGQAGDIGVIEDQSHIAEVLDTKKFFDLNLSQVKVANKNLTIGENVDGVVVNRYEVAKHHSATHLLQTALKMVLGENVAQAGSLNDASRLRFDFTYPKAMSKEQIKEVEDLVNSMIVRGIKSNIEELPINEAKQKGAIAMFGEKYGDMVRVVDFGGVSIEFCGGTHVRNSSDIGSFYIIKESGVSAGVRRIEAVCGVAAINYTNEIIQKYEEVQNEVKNLDATLGVKKLKDQIKQLKKELEESQSSSNSAINEEIIGDTKVVVDIVKNGDIKKIVDDLKNANEKLAVLLLQAKGDKVMIVAGSKNTPVKAGDWIKHVAPIVGGGGGGRPDFAQAGGKDVSKIDQALEKALEFVKDNL